MPVEVPAAVHLTGQDLIGHIAHKPLVDTQPWLIQQSVSGQCPLSISDGPLEATGALAADQVHQLLVADLAPLVALGQGHQHVQLGWVQGQLMAVHQTSEGVRANEACVLRVQLLRWRSRRPGAEGRLRGGWDLQAGSWDPAWS